MAYRRAGGENYSIPAKHCLLVAQAIREEKMADVEQELAKWANHPEAKLIISKLQAILNSDRNPKLADDADLYYQDVVELRLLLESLQRREYNG